MSNLPAQRLAASTPAQVNNSLASLAQQCGVSLRVSRDMEAKYDKTGVFLGYEPNGETLAIVNGTPEAVEAMLDRIDGAFAPADDGQIAVWLAELDVIAPSRAQSAANDDLRLQAYVSRLRGYPADIAREALLGRAWRFFPSWAEVKEACDELVKHRTAVRDALIALDRANWDRDNPEPEIVHKHPNADVRRRVAESVGDLLAEMQAKVRTKAAEEKAAAEAARASYRRSAGE